MIVIRGRHGLGDNIYQRAVLLEYLRAHPGEDVYLVTPWPQFYADMALKCCPLHSKLRTQAKNIAAGGVVWHAAPPGGTHKIMGYAAKPTGSILEALADSIGAPLPGAVPFRLPAYPARDAERAYVVIRPATVRREWRAEARNPRPEYLSIAADMARSAGYTIVSVADLQDGEEWALDPLPRADETYHAGELDPAALMALVAGAAGVIAGVGWAVPAAIACRTPLLCIYGGSGAFDSPARILDKRLPLGSVTNAIPDRFCMCNDRSHECDKRIGGFWALAAKWVADLASVHARPAYVAARSGARVFPRAGRAV